MFWGAFGQVIFRALTSPKSLRDSQAWRIGDHPVLQGHPVLHHNGPDLRRITLEIDLLRRFTLPLTPDMLYGWLVGYAERAEVHALIIGIDYVGDFAVARIDSEILASDMLGMTRHRRITLELVEAASSGGGIQGRIGSAVGKAIGSLF